MSKIKVKDQRIDLRPEVTALSPDGKLIYLAFVSMTMIERCIAPLERRTHF